MPHQLEKAKTIARCSLSLGGSLHPSTRHVVKELVSQLDAQFLERVDGVATSMDPNGTATVDVNMSPDRLVLTVVKCHAAEVWHESHLDCVQIQRELQPVVDGLWSVSASVAREVRRGVASERDDVDRLLDALLDEAKRIEKALSADEMKIRLKDLVRLRGYAQAVALPLHYIFMCGPITPTEFEQMMGHGLRSVAHRVMTKLLEDDLLRLNEDRLSFNLSENTAAILMPELRSY